MVHDLAVPARTRTRAPAATRPRAVAAACGCGFLLVLLFAPAPAAAADTTLERVEQEFQHAIRRVVPATVTCRPWAPHPRPGFSSGVIVSADGLVLSDGDAGLVWGVEDGKMVKAWRDEVEVRLHRESGQATRRYRARVLYRDTTVDTSLLQIVDPPARNLPHVLPGGSDDVRVGDFALALGSTFDDAGDSPPTLTAGLVSAFTYLDATPGAPNRYQFVYTSAAVNQNVNGGPLVDLEGRLIGTISTFLTALPDEDKPEDGPFQFLGKAVPIERIRRAMAGVPRAAALDARGHLRSQSLSAGRALEEVFHDAGRRGYRSVVSLDIERSRPLVRTVPLEDRTVRLPRYKGSVSGISVASDGLVLTSLYNLTNVAARARPNWEAPAGADVAAGLAAVTGATVHYGGGRTARARLVGHDLRLGVALFQADLPAGFTAPVPDLAPASALERGRFVLAVGNPFGSARPPDPLLTLGVLSKRHRDTAGAPWRGQWQTDAPGTDTNAGGAVVDVEGRLLGLLTIWHPARHGRNSGIAFVVPWDGIARALPALRRGEGPQPALLGVLFAGGTLPIIARVIEGSAAAAAGIRPGDRIRRMDGERIATTGEAYAFVAQRFAGESLDVVVERDGAEVALRARLQARTP